MPNHSIRDKTYPLLLAGKSVSEVCKELNCSKNAVLDHARELGVLPEERLTPRYDWEKIQEAYDLGACPSDCMRRFGFCKAAWARAEKLGKIKTDPARRRKRGVLNDDLSGQRFGKFTVIERVENNSLGNRQWRCRCDCGNEKILATARLKYEQPHLSCGCSKHRTGQDCHQWKGHGEIGAACWGSIKSNAFKRKSRVIPFEISIEQAWDLFLKQERKCAISGEILTFGSRQRTARTASLDRIDSSKGYTMDNVQWVHKDVNTMKWDNSLADFLLWVEKIHTFQAKKSS